MTIGELKLSVRAFNVIAYQVWYPRDGDLAAAEPTDVRELLSAKAGGQRRVWRWLMHQKNCGRVTANELCERLGFPAPQYVGHCPTCTCRKEHP